MQPNRVSTVLSKIGGEWIGYINMLRLLLLFGISFYIVLIVFGEDQGQLRAGLRDAPALPASAAPSPAPSPAPTELAAAPAEAEVTPADAPAVPDQALRVLSTAELSTPDVPTFAVLSENAAAEFDLQTASIPLDLPEDPAAANISLRWVAVDSANVRAQPGRDGAIAGRIARGEAVEVLWVEPSGWARIRVQGDGVDGFVFGDLLTDIDPTAN